MAVFENVSGATQRTENSFVNCYEKGGVENQPHWSGIMRRSQMKMSSLSTNIHTLEDKDTLMQLDTRSETFTGNALSTFKY